MNDIRGYFDTRIAEIDSKFKPWNDGFPSDNIPSTFINKSYFLLYNINSSEFLDQSMSDNYLVNLKLFFKGGRDVQTTIDESFDLANNIRVNIVKRENVFPSAFYNILPESMTFNILNGNDNSFYIEIVFELTKQNYL
ncbi:MAG: hypothetical protein OEL89_00345 [Candidatus Peregrinibacteria bacterium]|nr:hypothetical protein [Candidatus Peregrinibacteria bacterium]